MTQDTDRWLPSMVSTHTFQRQLRAEKIGSSRGLMLKWPIGCAVENFEPLKNGLEIRAEPLHLGFFRKSLEDGRIHTIHRLVFFHVSFTIGIGLGVIRLKKGSVDVPMH